MRSLGLVAVGLAAYTTGQAKSPSGYLPALGPAPLRFQVPPPVPEFGRPPEKPEPAPAPPGPSNDAAANRSAPGTPGPALSPGGPVGEGSLTASSSLLLTNSMRLALAEPMSPPLVSPQMLLHFFSDPGFTNRQTAISIPISFSPALPPQGFSSSATYTSNPKP